MPKTAFVTKIKQIFILKEIFNRYLSWKSLKQSYAKDMLLVVTRTEF